jgi:small-conductance mechanosensitive channel
MHIIEGIKNIRETTAGGIIISVIFYTIIVLVAIKISDYFTNKFTNKHSGKSALHWKFLKQVFRVIICVIGLFGIVSSIPSFDKVGTALVASSSVVVAAIGLASQESMANAINGLFITLFKPFVVGDRVRFTGLGVTGVIEDINLRHTVLRTFENNRLIIPNTTINKEILENFNYIDTKICNFLDIKIKYTSDYKKAIEIIEKIVLEHPLHIDVRTEEEKANGVPEVRVYVRNLSDTGIELRVGIWSEHISQSFQTCSELRFNILEEFSKNCIEMAVVNVKF